jgi:hypothetical protein
MQLKYYVPFKAQEGVDAQFALKERLINIEGLAVDTSVNKNKWQVPEEDLDFFTATLKDAQLRADHAESVFMIVGKVPEARRKGQEVYFRAEVGGEEKLIDKILRGYVKYVSVQVDSDDVECSRCKKPTRKEGLLVHLCPDAWEIVHKPRVRELSIVASPAYEKTEFKPVGFAAAMDLNQQEAARAAGSNPAISRSLESDDVGSRREPQGPENKKNETKEVKHLPEQNAQQGASPHQAQGVVNVAPGEQAPKEHTYQEYIDQLTQLEKQIMQRPGASDAELDSLNKKLVDLEGELAKRARKAELGKKISELSKKLGEAQEEGQEEGEEEGKPPSAEEAKRASGKGIVATDEINRDALGNYDWFKDLIKASRKINAGFK